MTAKPLDDFPAPLRQAISDGKALFVCGAGLSRLVTGELAPGWRTLIDHALKAAIATGNLTPGRQQACRALLGPGEPAGSWLEAADMIQSALGGSDGGLFRAVLKEAVGFLVATKRGALALEALHALKACGNRLATTNYDHLLTTSFTSDPVTWLNPSAVAETLRGDRDAVWHIHGEWSDPKSVIFSAADYTRVGKSDLAQFMQQLATHQFTLVFVGCGSDGLADENVGELLNWFRKNWTGLGSRHYAFSLAADVSKAWPTAVTPVAYGDAHEDLTDFLLSLRPAPHQATAPFILPPDPGMIGRQHGHDELVDKILSNSKPIIVPGGPGIGKTTLAVSAANDAKVAARFGTRRFFVNLESATTADAMLRATAISLGADAAGSTDQVLAGVQHLAGQASAMVILDNLETPWHAERKPCETILDRLAAISGLHLILTVRGETPRISTGSITLDDVAPLAAEDARSLFVRECGNRFASDNALERLLRNLDGHPHAIVLMAANAEALSDLADLERDWNKYKVQLLEDGAADDRRTSFRISLGLSLDRLSGGPLARTATAALHAAQRATRGRRFKNPAWRQAGAILRVGEVAPRRTQPR